MLSIQLIYLFCRHYAVSEGINMPWLSLNAIGFCDSPVSWKTKLHSYFTNGDNHFTIFISPHKQFISFKVTPSNSKNKSKQWIYVDHLKK